MDEIRRETRQGFTAANQKFELINSNMTVGGVSLTEFQGGGKCLIEGWSDV
jgi:hypothetical protein